MDWPERYALELSSRGGVPLELSREEVGALLRLSREVAHRTERRWAPLSAYLAGRFVEARLAAGVPPAQALEEAAGLAESILPAGDPGAGGDAG